VLPNLTDH